MNVKLYLLPLLFLTLFACNKDEVENSSNNNVKHSTSGLNSRVDLFWKEIEPFSKSDNDSITFYYIADVKSPVVHGIACSATGMEIVGHLCYVTYHIAGGTYGGAIEVFDISTPSNPELVDQLIFDDAGFNECTVSDGKLYAVGGRDIYSSKFTENDTKGGVLVEISLNNGLLTTDMRWQALPSYSGNSVNVVNSYLFVTSGSTGGGVFTLNKSNLEIIQEDYFVNPKFCDIRDNQLGNQMVVLQGYPEAILHEYSAGPNNIAGKQTHNILTQNVPYNGKAVVHIDGDNVFVCTGANGLMGFESTNLSTPFLNFSSPDDGNSNGVHTDDRFIYVSNGEEGIIIVNKDDYSIHSIFDNHTGSANYVKVNGKYVFISHGKGGVKILRRADPLPEDNDCSDREELSPSNINGAFVVNLGLQLTYKGDNTFNKGLTNHGEFYYCGNLKVNQKTILNHGSITHVEGAFHTQDLILNPGATLIINGDLIIDGDFTFRGHLEFIGENNTVIINGNVTIGNDATIEGQYTSNKNLE